VYYLQAQGNPFPGTPGRACVYCLQAQGNPSTPFPSVPSGFDLFHPSSLLQSPHSPVKMQNQVKILWSSRERFVSPWGSPRAPLPSQPLGLPTSSLQGFVE
jgi:hypothetical protein